MLGLSLSTSKDKNKVIHIQRKDSNILIEIHRSLITKTVSRNQIHHKWQAVSL